MSLQECKIESYKTGVSSLPDYPSDAGYTAAALKAVFDARSDGEIREKHNALVDEIVAKTEEIAEDIAQAETSAKEYADSLSGNYDSAGSAAAAETSAKEYADSLAANYDPAGSAAAAEANAKAYAESAISAAISAISNGDEVSY